MHQTWERAEKEPERGRRNRLGVYANYTLPLYPRSTPTPAAVIELSPAPMSPPAARATWERRPCQAPRASESRAAESAPQKPRGYTHLRRGAPDTVIRRNSHALGRTETTCHDIFNAPPCPLFPSSFPGAPPPLPEALSGAFGVSNLSDTVECGAPRARARPIRVPSASPGQWQAPHCCPILSNGALRSNNRAGEWIIESLAAPGYWGPAVRSVRRAPRGDAARRGPGRGFQPAGP